MLAQLLLAAAALAQSPQEDPMESPNLACAGGVQIFFEQGSDRIDTKSTEYLNGFSSFWRGAEPAGLLRIEAGGDGTGTSFDADLARRRAAAVRAYLLEAGFRAKNILVLVGDGLTTSQTSEEMKFLFHMGWVSRFISKDEYARLYPKGLILECF